MENKIKYHNTAGCFVTKEVDGERSVLLVHCQWQDGSKGWVPPKGHLEENESPENAATREVAEETGYSDIRIIKHLKDVSIEYKAEEDDFIHKKVIKWYLAELISETQNPVNFTPNEKIQIKETHWIPLSDAVNKIPFKDEQEIIKDIIAYYSNGSTQS